MRSTTTTPAWNGYLPTVAYPRAVVFNGATPDEPPLTFYLLRG